MSRECCEPIKQIPEARYRKVLWIALIANLSMCCIEIIAGRYAGSTSLMADAMEFLVDSINYGVSLFALSLPLIWRSRIALVKGATMVGYGALILIMVSLSLRQEHVPLASIMGFISLLALAVNFGVAWLLYQFRQGDSNMQSVWLCSRNDAIINIAVLLAALGVWLTHQSWPDLVVALCISGLGLTSGYAVIKRARHEMIHHH
ncbi:MAG: cation transporter [Burkholderiales bacterium]